MRNGDGGGSSELAGASWRGRNKSQFGDNDNDNDNGNDDGNDNDDRVDRRHL